MKPDYKNWMPKGMIASVAFAAVICLILTIITFNGWLASGTLRTVLFVVFLLATVCCIVALIWMTMMFKAFSYDGKRQMSKRIIEGVANFVAIPEGGKGLDVGCGSGALTIAVAKRNPQAEMVGVDRWGKDYASYNISLCKHNAEAEGVKNVSFAKGNAIKLDFKDETFDAVVSNYVYHNITGNNLQTILLETLRTLKKGGTFVIHDIFTKANYGDMQAFMLKLKEMGYESVELVNTSSGMFMTSSEARWMMLKGSAILKGKK